MRTQPYFIRFPPIWRSTIHSCLTKPRIPTCHARYLLSKFQRPMEFSQYLEEEPEGSQPYSLNQSQPYTCAKGHRSSLSLPTPSDGRICLVCLTNLLSDPHALSHHLSFALSNLSLALRCDRIPSTQTSSFVASLRTCHPHLLVGPLVRALSSACDRADDALSRQVAEVVVELAAALDASVVEDLVARISDMLCLSGSLIRQLPTVYLSPFSAFVSVV